MKKIWNNKQNFNYNKQIKTLKNQEENLNNKFIHNIYIKKMKEINIEEKCYKKSWLLLVNINNKWNKNKMKIELLIKKY